jgi:conjugative transfer pilus assembly protein TraH
MDWGALLQALRLRRRLMGFLAMLAIANIVAAQTAEADVGSAMNSFFNGMGGAANATGPSPIRGRPAAITRAATSGCARPTSS